MNTIKMWIAMKKKEIEFKLMAYTYGIRFMDEKEDLIKSLWNIYEVMKKTPMNELQDRFIIEMASLAHEQAQKERQKEKEEMNDAE